MRRATRRRLRSALAVCAMGIGLCFAPIASRAETFKGLELERRMREATWHWGPFYIQPQFVLSNVGVDSNVYYSTNNPIKDFTLTAGPAATVATGLMVIVIDWLTAAQSPAGSSVVNVTVALPAAISPAVGV